MTNRKKNLRFSTLLSISIVVLMSCTKDKNDPDVLIEDLFKKDASGWTIVGDAQGGYVEPSYSPDGGVIDGYIYAEDNVLGGVWYFSAPKTYQGNKAEYYNKTIHYSLFQKSNMSDQFDREDIIFKSDNKQIFYLVTEYPTDEWTSYSVKINEANGWYVGTFQGQNSPATEADMKEVLSNVKALWIRGEFEVGPDTGGLDKVQIKK